MDERTTISQLDPKDFPLPIAYKLMQLQNIPPGLWIPKCQQLVHTFGFAVRYCAVVALSEYRRLVSQYGLGQQTSIN